MEHLREVMARQQLRVWLRITPECGEDLLAEVRVGEFFENTAARPHGGAILPYAFSPRQRGEGRRTAELVADAQAELNQLLLGLERIAGEHGRLLEITGRAVADVASGVIGVENVEQLGEDL